MTEIYCQICRGNLREGETLSQHFAFNQIYLTFFICENCERCYSTMYVNGRGELTNADLTAVTRQTMGSQIANMRARQKLRPSNQLKEEIDRKGAQLSGLPYIAIEYSRDRDYDRFWSKRLWLLKGFLDQYAAIHHVDELADSIRKSLLAEEDAVWREQDTWQEHFAASHDKNDLICCVYKRGFEYDSHRLWETKHISFEVLHLQDPEQLEAGLCSYFVDEFLEDSDGRFEPTPDV
jgi:hypothetical protein